MKILTIFGTRPEAIKLAAVVKKLKIQSPKFSSAVCVTAQHREMLDQVLNIFQIVPDYDLDIMTDHQNLFDLTCKVLDEVGEVLTKEKPDLVLVQGDTTTAFAASLAAYYMQIPVGHVEAGLRTYDKYNPFPEEKNRHLVGVLADYHFAPTDWAKSNLLKENIKENRIWVTGNTVIDALLSITKLHENSDAENKWFDYFQHTWGLNLCAEQNKIILVTGHRRESFGEGFKNICLALSKISELYPEATIVYPVHLNPNVQRPVIDILGPIRNQGVTGGSKIQPKNIFLFKPLDYEPFIFLMGKAYLVLTDSGGIQEEAPSLGKPVLVMREKTERPEGIEAGTSRLVGTQTDGIVNAVDDLLRNSVSYNEMTKINNPYGDGNAAERIVEILATL